jgi:phosphoribosylanthranilate isomerase
MKQVKSQKSKVKSQNESLDKFGAGKAKVKVKICGITNLEDALCAQDAGADFLGFVFAESPRRISGKAAKKIIEQLSQDITIVALFVNETTEIVDSIINTIGRVDIVQFHGDETPEYCNNFSSKKIIKAFRAKDEMSISRINRFKDVDFVLVDAYSEDDYGGTGKEIDLDLALKAKEYGYPLFLSGGLNPMNVKQAILKVNPFCVDVSSGVEKIPGKKDHALIREFIKNSK